MKWMSIMKIRIRSSESLPRAPQHHTDDFLQTDELLANRKSEILYKEKYTNVLSPT